LQTRTQRTPFLTLPSVRSNLPYTYQANVGVQRQIAPSTSLATDFVYTKMKDVVGIMDVNLAFDPATGGNYPFTDLTRRPVRGWGAVNQNVVQSNGPESYAVQFELNKRMANHWQLSATYLLQFNYEYQYAPINRDKGCKYALTNPSPGVFTCDAPITLNPLMIDEKYLTGDQRNRATFNGIWELPAGFPVERPVFLRRQREDHADLRRRPPRHGRVDDGEHDGEYGYHRVGQPAAS
jgi:hypothetical protein